MSHKIPVNSLNQRVETLDGVERKSQSESAMTNWTPFWIQRATLDCFLATFVAVGAALEIIHQWSIRHDGLANTQEAYRYLYTYGPTLCKLSPFKRESTDGEES